VWLATLIAIPFWIANDGPIAWDFGVTQKAMQSLQAGADPYLAGIAVQDAFLHSADAKQDGPRPFVYVYSPITLPVLKLLNQAPPAVFAAGYWLVYGLFVFLQLWVSLRLAGPGEKLFAFLIAPITVFFPGMLLFDSVLGGNVAFMLYGFIFIAAWLGWKRNQWLLFYLAVIAASCIKAPYLTLLAIPLLSGRKQWGPATVAAIAGVGLFASQIRIWPVEFHNYLLAVDRIFSFNNDFGSGPAGRLGALLATMNLPYATASTLFYLCASIPLFLFLLYLSRRYKKGELSSAQWIPVMLLGVLLLNPRLIEYDIFPFTVAMALIAYRMAVATGMPRRVSLIVLPLLGGLNCLANDSRNSWKNMECGILVFLFLAGSWHLLRQANQSAQALSIRAEAENAEAELVLA